MRIRVISGQLEYHHRQLYSSNQIVHKLLIELDIHTEVLYISGIFLIHFVRLIMNVDYG